MTRARAVRRAQEGGFSLIELLVAMTVTIIGLLGLLSLHTTTMDGTASSAQFSEGSTFAREMMEDMRARSIAQLEGDFGPLPITTSDVVSGRANQTYTRTISLTPTPVSPDLVLMRVVVNWTEAGAIPGSDDGRYDHAVTLELLRTRQEIF